MDFILRPWQERDCFDLAKYANNRKISENLRDIFPYPYTVEDAKWYINMCRFSGDRADLSRAIDVNGHAVGSISLSFKSDIYRKSAELGYWLGQPYWNKGIVTRAINQLCGYAFMNYDIARIYAEVFANNTASRRVLEKCGFVLEGTFATSLFKDGQFYDSCIYSLLKYN